MTATERPGVVMVGINYAPEHTGIGPYTTAAAEHLTQMARDVIVHTGVPHYPHWSILKHYRWRLSAAEVSSGVQVRRYRHFVPGSQDFLRRGLYEATFAVHFALRARRARADVVVAVVPSLLSAVAAARLARRNGARLILWVQDSMGAAATQSGLPGGRLVARNVVRLEQAVIRQAEWVLLASDAFRPYVEQACNISSERVVTIPNWVHLDQPTRPVDEVRRQLGWADDDTIVLHTGNMGFKQDLTAVIEAAKIADRHHSRLRFVLMGDGSQRESLQALAVDVKGVEFAAPVSRSDYVNVLTAADILLVNERRGVLDMSLPSKLTSYFGAGRPVLACVDHQGGTASEVRRSQAGVITAAQTPEAIFESAATLAQDAQLGQTLGFNGQMYAKTNLSAKASLDLISQIVCTGVLDEQVGVVEAAR